MTERLTTGVTFTGRCRCGHRFDEHHNPMWFSTEYAATLPPGARPYVAEECEHYGCDEEGGLGPDLRVHCARYVDRADPNPPDPADPSARGTFTRWARVRAWLRFGWQVIQIRMLRRDARVACRRERW
jgi:hypothetical protein